MKSGRTGVLSGMVAFLRTHKQARPFLSGSGGMSFEEFFARNPGELFD